MSQETLAIIGTIFVVFVIAFALVGFIALITWYVDWHKEVRMDVKDTRNDIAKVAHSVGLLHDYLYTIEKKKKA